MITQQRELFQVFEAQTGKVTFRSRKNTLLLEYCVEVWEHNSCLPLRIIHKKNERAREVNFSCLNPKKFRQSDFLVIWLIQTPGYYNQTKLIKLMKLLILRLSNQGFKLRGLRSDFGFFFTESLRIAFSTSLKKTHWFWELLGLVWCTDKQMNERLRDRVMPIMCTLRPALIFVNAVILGCSTPVTKGGQFIQLDYSFWRAQVRVWLRTLYRSGKGL